ncbi:MAG: family 16 glycosylhydrolase [Flavobacteriales bacterium]
MKYPILFFLLISYSLSAQLKPILFQFRTDTVLTWHYQFGDEFSGSTIDQNKWITRYPWGGLLLDQSQWSTPEMLQVQNGWLHLNAVQYGQKAKVEHWMINQDQAQELKIDIKNDSVYLDYLTSCLWSKDTFRYGYFECRAIVPSGQGLWPAFWLYGQNQKDEIDFMEMKGERPNDIHVDIHLPNRKDYVKNKLGIKKDWGGWVSMEPALTEDTLIFSGVWLPNSLTYFVNGTAVSHFNGDFQTAMNLIVNLAVARDGYAFNPGPNDQTKFPATFQVDYLRVWNLDPTVTQKMSSFPQINPQEINVIQEEKKQLKKRISLIYPKRTLEKEQGFVSLIPIGAQQYAIQSNGTSDFEISFQGENQTENRIKGKKANIIDLQNAPKNLSIIITCGNQKVAFFPLK